LTLLTRITRQTAVRIDHAYELRRQDVLVAEGSTTIASVNRQGQVIPIPDRLGKPS
jgi:acyl-CoA thioester hydrolase